MSRADLIERHVATLDHGDHPRHRHGKTGVPEKAGAEPATPEAAPTTGEEDLEALSLALLAADLEEAAQLPGVSADTVTLDFEDGDGDLAAGEIPIEVSAFSAMSSAGYDEGCVPGKGPAPGGACSGTETTWETGPSIQVGSEAAVVGPDWMSWGETRHLGASFGSFYDLDTFSTKVWSDGKRDSEADSEGESYDLSVRVVSQSWSASGGSITADGVFTAPDEPDWPEEDGQSPDHLTDLVTVWLQYTLDDNPGDVRTDNGSVKGDRNDTSASDILTLDIRIGRDPDSFPPPPNEGGPGGGGPGGGGPGGGGPGGGGPGGGGPGGGGPGGGEPGGGEPGGGDPGGDPGDKETADPEETCEEKLERYLLDRLPDRDGDGLPDLFETQCVGSDPDLGDTDEDGLGDAEEYELGLNPRYFDSDGDLLPDSFEARYWDGVEGSDFDPRRSGDPQGDADGDGLVNLDEAIFGSDPTGGDTDGDGDGDKREADQGSDPGDASDEGKAPPDDQKGIFTLTIGDPSGSHSERWRLDVGDLQYVSPGFGEVGSRDFFFNVGEMYDVGVKHLGTNIDSPDYDYRADITSSEVAFFVADDNDPTLLQPGIIYGADKNPARGKSAKLILPQLDLDVDSDNNDGFNEPGRTEDEDRAEQTPDGKHLFANDGDLDADGLLDSDDLQITGGAFVPVVISLSENLQEADPSAVNLTFAYAAAGAVGSSSGGGGLRLWRRDAPERSAEDFIAGDATLTAEELGLSPGGSVTLYAEATGPLPETEVTVTADVEGSLWSGTLTDTVHLGGVGLGIAVDIDADGFIRHDGTDLQDENAPFSFWTNSDADVWVSGTGPLDNDYAAEGPGNAYADWATAEIGRDPGDGGGAGLEVIRRDLEDFFAISFRIPDEDPVGEDFRYEVELVGSGGLRLHDASDAPEISNGETSRSRAHVEDVNISESLAETLHTVENDAPDRFLDLGGDTPAELPQGWIARAVASTTEGAGRLIKILVEGFEEAVGDLVLRAVAGGRTLGEQAVQLALRPVQEFYDRFSVSGLGRRASVEQIETYFDDRTATRVEGFGTAPPPADRTDDYQLFVHGWNMSPEAKEDFADTFYKRNWWAGYRGGMGLFDWPTDYTDGLLQSFADYENYFRSEHIALQSGESLRGLLERLRAEHGGRLALAAHSMGNVVANEALRQWELVTPEQLDLVDAYAMMQAAVATDAFTTVNRIPEENQMGVVGPDWDTPSAYEYHPGTGRPYFEPSRSAAGSVYNYWNERDFALGIWQEAQKQKPGPFSERYLFLNSAPQQPSGHWVEDDANHFVIARRGSEEDSGNNPEPDDSDQSLVVVRNLWMSRSHTLPDGTFTNPQNDSHIVYGYAAEPRGHAVGSVGALRLFDGSRDLGSDELGGMENQSFNHSGQFNRTFLVNQGFYRTLLGDLGVGR